MSQVTTSFLPLPLEITIFERNNKKAIPWTAGLKLCRFLEFLFHLVVVSQPFEKFWLCFSSHEVALPFLSMRMIGILCCYSFPALICCSGKKKLLYLYKFSSIWHFIGCFSIEWSSKNILILAIEVEYVCHFCFIQYMMLIVYFVSRASKIFERWV